MTPDLKKLPYPMARATVFAATSLWAIAFVGNLGGARSIDHGPRGQVLAAAAIDALLLGLFVGQQQLIATSALRRLNRSTRGLITSAVLWLIFGCWQPMQLTLWDLQSPAATTVPRGLFWLGGAIAVVALLHPRASRGAATAGISIALWSTAQMTVGHLLFAVAISGCLVIQLDDSPSPGVEHPQLPLARH